MGAEIIGLDLSLALSGTATRRVQEAFNEYKVLCFRDQQLTMDQLVSFSKTWGPLVEHTMPGQLRDGITEINIATNADTEGKPSGKHPDLTAMRWHTDRSWRIEPALATILYGVEVPSTGGDTLFSNCTKAYDGLPDEMKRRVDPLRAIHSVEYSRKTGDGPAATEYELLNHPPTPHPLARRHPATGHKALFCGCHAWMIEGWPEQQGRELLDQMQAFATRDEFVYRHKWRRHDLLMWDNRCTMHAATPYDTAKELRTMYRTVVAGGPTS
jgi:taurine dioxygenase